MNPPILLNIESGGDYMDKFHGEDGYMHYAKLAGIENLTEEQVKNRMKFASQYKTYQSNFL